MPNLITKIQSNSKIKLSDILANTKLLNSSTRVITPVPLINVALSGSIYEGMKPGALQIAGPSKHFKTLFALLFVASYMKANPDGVMIFYDTEFGAAKKYFQNFNIDTNRVLHSPVTNIEELKYDIMNQLENIERGEKVIFFIDSIGNLASSKEIEDAKDNKQVADMTRAKSLKSLGRMIRSPLAIKDLYLVAVNHTYKTLEMYSKDVVGGGCVVEGTKIWTVNGPKNIEDVEKGEIVFTLSGEKMVTATWNPETLDEGFTECYEIEFEDGYICTVSHNHLFLTEHGWKQADELSKNDKIINTSIKQMETGIWIKNT